MKSNRKMHIEILHATIYDLETILQLQKDCYTSEAELYNDYKIQPLQQDLELLEDEFKNSVVLKAVSKGIIVGSVRGFINNKTLCIGKLIVEKEYQNNGIGKLLIQSIESVSMDFNRFELFTGFKSQKNLYLYHKLGYKEFKRQIINENLTLIYLEKKR